MVQLSHPYMTTGKTIVLTIQTFVSRVVSLLLYLVHCLGLSQLSSQGTSVLISWFQSLSTVIWEPKKIRSLTTSTVSPSVCFEVMGLDAIILVFSMLSFKPAFSLSSYTFIKTLFSFSLLSAIRVVSSTYISDITWISAVVDISPSKLESTLLFIQPGILHDILYIYVK